MRKIFLISLFISQTQVAHAGGIPSFASFCEFLVQPYKQMRARKSGEARVRYNRDMLEQNAIALAADPELAAQNESLNSMLNTVLALDLKLFTFDVDGEHELMLFKRGTVIETYFNLVGHAKLPDQSEMSFRHYRFKVRGIL